MGDRSRSRCCLRREHSHLAGPVLRSLAGLARDYCQCTLHEVTHSLTARAHALFDAVRLPGRQPRQVNVHAPNSGTTVVDPDRYASLVTITNERTEGESAVCHGHRPRNPIFLRYRPIGTLTEDVAFTPLRRQLGNGRFVEKLVLAVFSAHLDRSDVHSGHCRSRASPGRPTDRSSTNMGRSSAIGNQSCCTNG